MRGIESQVENEIEDWQASRGETCACRYSPDLLQRQLPPIRGELVASLIDEIPVLAVLGSQAAGGLTISDAQELRVKESDRISAIVTNLRAMGAEVEEKPDGLIIQAAGNCTARISSPGTIIASPWPLPSPRWQPGAKRAFMMPNAPT